MAGKCPVKDGGGAPLAVIVVDDACPHRLAVRKASVPDTHIEPNLIVGWRDVAHGEIGTIDGDVVFLEHRVCLLTSAHLTLQPPAWREHICGVEKCPLSLEGIGRAALSIALEVCQRRQFKSLCIAQLAAKVVSGLPFPDCPPVVAGEIKNGISVEAIVVPR